MSDLKPTGTKIKLGNKEYGLRFTLNAIDDIQEHFNIPISKLVDLFKDEKTQIKNLRFMLMTLINEDLDCRADETGEKAEHLEERYIGRHIDAGNIRNLIGATLKSFSSGTPEIGEDDDPNPESGQ
ncbi:MAG TPA: hypothetical protein P5519_09785 [Spirochaetia bacterium]|mgnify:CR=1 FL=1|nr:hypothetical protein [Spirochaetia bacterium]